MLFLTFGNFFMLGIQFLIETIRCQRYWRTMQRLLRTASIIVQRAGQVQSSNHLRASVLNLAESSENLEFEDDYIQISSQQPMQEIDLSSWTAYTSYLETHNAVAMPNQDICILMEARRPLYLNKFVSDSLKVSPAYRVHVLSLACPLAWKTTEPFGIILHCSSSGLVSLTDAFGQGRLTLDEDLELTGFATVKAVGSPQKLVPQNEESAVDNCQAFQEADSSSRTYDSVSGQNSFKFRRGTHDERIDISNQGRQSDASYTQENSMSSLDNCQQLGVEIDISSNNNFEVDHAEAFVVKQPAQIDSKTFRQQAANIPLNSDHDLKDEPLFDKAGRGHEGSCMKPPNILVYCGIKDSARLFTQVQSSLEACINAENYTIYHLKHDSILSTPWRNNAALLVVSSCARLTQDAETEIENYVLRDGGTLLSFNSSVDSVFAEKLEEEGLDKEQLVSFKIKDSQTITSVRGRFLYGELKENSEVVIPYEFCEQQKRHANKHNGPVETDNTGSISSHVQNRALVVKIKCESGGVAVLSQLLLERDPTEYAKDQDSFTALKQSNTDRLAVLRDILASLGIDTSSGTTPMLTTCLLLVQRVGLKESFMESFQQRLKDNLLKSQKMSLKFVESSKHTSATPTLLPVVTNIDIDVKAEYFDPVAYWKNLKTLKLGQILFYTEVITSTMPVFDGLQFSIPDDVGLIAVAGRQTSGRGRGGNSWLSPAGCAMFTLPLSLSVDSKLGLRVSFLQHVVSVAVVHSVLTLPGYENLNIKLKWPNDIYYGKEMKLGGILVTSTLIDSTIYATIGCGFNVSNSNPTICINDIIRLRNISNPELPALSPLSSSQLIARTVTCLEALLQSFEKDGHTAFCDKYYEHWLHGDSKVSVQTDKNTDGVIVGLDDFGFLSVRTPDGVISVQPDGNSFDMLHNLIHVKSRP